MAGRAQATDHSDIVAHSRTLALTCSSRAADKPQGCLGSAQDAHVPLACARAASSSASWVIASEAAIKLEPSQVAPSLGGTAASLQGARQYSKTD